MRVKGKRSQAVERLSELTGEKAVYTRLPRCAYEVGSFTIEKDGTLLVGESADLSFLRALANEGFLEDFEERVSETPEVSGTAQPEKLQEASISFPMAGHTVRSLRNLIHMIYAKGKLMSKSTGGEFFCAGEIVERLNKCENIEDVIAVSQTGLIGLKFTEDEIAFTGFPPTNEKVFTQLAAQMNEKAKERDHVIARRLDETNERYIFRAWLISIGMGGPEFKAARKMLLSPLLGHSAFKDEAMERRWKEKQSAKKYMNNKLRD